MSDAPADTVAARLAEAGYVLPQPPAPVAAYVPAVLAGGLLHVSGQVSFLDGQLITGRLGENVSLEQGQIAARADLEPRFDQFRAAGKVQNGADRVGDVARAGVGIGAVPDYAMSENTDLVRILTDLKGPKIDVYFVYPEELRNSKRVAVFRDFLLARLAEMPH